MEDEVVVARIYISEADHGRRTSLMKEMLRILHDEQQIRDVVVFRGIAGFGAGGAVVAEDMLRLNVDLPLVMEFFEAPATAEAALAVLATMVPPGHIVTWTARLHPTAPPQSA